MDDIEGTDGTGAPSDEPLRVTRTTASGMSGFRIVYAEPDGSHGWFVPEPDAPFDINTYATTQSAWFLATGGQDVSEQACFETADCPFFRQ